MTSQFSIPVSSQPTTAPLQEFERYGVSGRALQLLGRIKPWEHPASELERIAHQGHFSAHIESGLGLTPTEDSWLRAIEISSWLTELRQASVRQSKERSSKLIFGFNCLLTAAGIHGPTAAIEKVALFDPLGEGRALAKILATAPHLVVIPLTEATGPTFHLQDRTDWIQFPAGKLLVPQVNLHNPLTIYDNYIRAINVVAYGLATVLSVAGLSELTNQRTKHFRLVQTDKTRVDVQAVRTWCAWFDLACEALEETKKAIGGA